MPHEGLTPVLSESKGGIRVGIERRVCPRSARADAFAGKC